MEWFFGFLKSYPYILLFFTVGLAVAIGRVSYQGLRPRHGRRRGHRWCVPVGLGVDLRREAGAR